MLYAKTEKTPPLMTGTGLGNDVAFTCEIYYITPVFALDITRITCFPEAI
jgi:hypothetical protein